MQLEPFICPLDPITKTTLKMYLFENVKNIPEIRLNVMQDHWKCAVIKPSLIMDPMQVVIAVNKAAVAHHYNTMITKTVYTECVYNLCVSKSISTSLSRFGLEKNRDILVCFLVTPENDDSQDILDNINGNVCPISDLNKFYNLKEIIKVYQVDDLKCNDYLLNVILTKIALKPIFF